MYLDSERSNRRWLGAVVSVAIGVALGALRYNQHQLRLFGGESHQKWEQTLAHVDKMREKFGFDAVHFGKALGAETPPPPTLARPEDGPAR